MVIFRIFTNYWNSNDSAGSSRRTRSISRIKALLIHDDYSGTSFYTESEKYQEPKISKREQRKLYRDFWNFVFIQHLMQPYRYPDHLMDFHRHEKPVIKMDVWLKEQRQHIKETEQYLQKRQQERNGNDDTRQCNPSI